MTMAPANPPAAPSLVIVCNSIPPYRIHLHRRVAHEVPELKLWTVVTHENRTDRWGYQPTEDIGAILFGPGEMTEQQGSLKFALHEWSKGGRIIQWLERQNVKAVVVCGYNDLGRMRIILWCRRKNIPCFISGDANILIDRPSFLKKIAKHAVVRPLLRAATGMLPCGRNGKAFFLRYGARPDRIYWFPYEPDFAQIQNLGPAAIDQVRQHYKLAENRRRIVFSGRLIELKRVDLLIEAFIAIAPERPNWDLMVIGDGPLESVLRAAVPECLRERVQWTGFIGDQSTISALYRCCDLLALPSNREQWALVVLEAAAAGLAIIADETVGSATEFIQNHINGRTYPSDNSSAITACLHEVTDAQRIDSMKTESLRILTEWRQRYDPIQGLRRALRDAKVLKI